MEEIKDDELDKLLEQKAQEKANSVSTEVKTQVPNINAINSSNQRTGFAHKMDEVKINVLADASTEDKNFEQTIKKNLKEAAIRHTEVEKDKAELEDDYVKADREEVDKKRAKNKHEMNEDVWNNKQKQRQYVYDGVKPVMKFVGIEEPFSCWLMGLFAVLLIIPYFINKFWKGTFGVLIFGACDSDRSKSMRGLLWTLLVIIIISLMLVGAYLFLKGQGIDLLENFK